MAKPRYKTTNWKHFNQTSVNDGSLTFWIDKDDAIQLWKQIMQENRRSPRLFSDLALTTAHIVKRVFSLLLRSLQGVINSIFKLTQLSLLCPQALLRDSVR
ncbi:transposase [Vibrio cholerae]|nr:transposase [Vibrio cholerae]CAB1255157.1 transposase [Vibrio cholerae]